MRISGTAAWWLVAMLACALAFGACGGDDDDDSSDEGATDDDTDDDTTDDDDDTLDDDDTADDDTSDDDTGDDDTVVDPFPMPSENPSAKADAFRLFYRERNDRANLSLNRFGVGGDAVFANAFDQMAIAKDGNEYEVVVGPNDNNPIGVTAYTAWKLYKTMGGRNLELTLIRLFEGLAFNEAVSGHPGLTCREALPGWTRTMDGVSDTVTRTRFGAPFVSPWTYPPALEKEVLDTFYDGVVIKYRENPEEYFFNFKPINSLESFAVTWVFDELPHFLRLSDCCSSFMRTPEGYDWEGAYWGNHNSRDNFTDYAMGYIAALEATRTPDLPDDLADAAEHAVEAATRTADAITEAGMIQMTVPEWDDYDVLVPGGIDRPDLHGEIEGQDLGSLASCTMVYTAQALSTEGLEYPVPELPLPGDVIYQTVTRTLERIGIHVDWPVPTCKSIDEAFIGLTWREILEMKIGDEPLFDWLGDKVPWLLPLLLDGTADDFEEMLLGAVTLCEYARVTDRPALYVAAKTSLYDLLEVTRILVRLVYEAKSDSATWGSVEGEIGAASADGVLESVGRLQYMSALYGRMYDLETPMEDFGAFDLGDSRVSQIEAYLTYGDTADKPLMTDQQIYDRVLDPESGRLWQKDEWIQERYLDRFGDTVPVRRAGDGYEAISADDEWHSVENDHHRWFGSILMWHESALCAESTHTLDCAWATIGCEPVDLNESGAVDEADQALFDTAWSTYGEDASCDSYNDHCDDADLDGDGTLTADDAAFMAAAQGCWY
ncbi:MAG: hypothetical protein H6684_04860 [Deltaproteobacteria bacterium]|nr:hypothetical protein [Deltaproteobacteria bacterium]